MTYRLELQSTALDTFRTIASCFGDGTDNHTMINRISRHNAKGLDLCDFTKDIKIYMHDNEVRMDADLNDEEIAMLSKSIMSVFGLMRIVKISD